MKGYDVLYELYQGKLNPGDRGYRNDTFFAIAMDAFKEHEVWLREKLDGESGQRFDELISCHNSIVDTLSYENFKSGFQLGVMLIMEAVNENPSALYEL